MTELEETLAPYMSLNKPSFDPEAIPARRRYLWRCYKLLSNMIRWRKYAGERYGLGMLITSLVTKTILPVAESGWEVGGEECLRKVSEESSPIVVYSCHFAQAVEILPAELIPSTLQARLRAT